MEVPHLKKKKKKGNVLKRRIASPIERCYNSLISVTILTFKK